MITKCKSIFIVFALLVVSSSRIHARSALKENDTCETTHYKGMCTPERNCKHIFETLNRMYRTPLDVGYCNFKAYEKIICCPNALEKASDENDERPAARACKEIENGLEPNVGPHISNGHKVEISEYPHMASIIYEPPKYNCSGILIHKRFILTSAHCLLKRGATPKKVIMGIGDFKDPKQWDNRQEINISRTHPHNNYSSEDKINDIGLIELVQEVKYGLNVYPTCLQTDPINLPANTELIVTGWGLTKNLEMSSHLNNASLLYVPLSQCNESYIKQLGENRTQLKHGITKTHICAFSNKSDTCAGDSGGPVHIVKNKAINNYRVVGIVASGFPCGTPFPGIYTRVSEFLNFIESKVWPSST